MDGESRKSAKRRVRSGVRNSACEERCCATQWSSGLEKTRGGLKLYRDGS